MDKGTQTRQAAAKSTSHSSVGPTPAPQSALNPWFRLQRNVGNQAMSRLLQTGVVQAKLRVSQPGDADEDEAARAAKSDQRGPTLGLIVEDKAPVSGPGQMKKSVFLDLLQADICATADAELAAVGRSTQSCPYIAKWLVFYRGQSGAHIERAVLKYAPEAAEATTARDYIRDVRHRVRRAVAIWAKTGRVTGMPPGVGLMPAEAGGAENKKDEGFGTGLLQAVSGGGRAQLKEREGATTQPADAESVRDQLGHGRTLDSRIRGRMESAFGSDFSSVRVHDDGTAWGLTTQLNARAFTVGNDIAFNTGEYKPGTPVGDALIAHELAHVVQQGAAGHSHVPMLKGESDYNALEEDADVSAVGVIASLWTGVKGKLNEIGKNAAPRLRSGLKLQRCTFEHAPTNLKTAEAKAMWIAQAMKDDDALASQEIVKMFKSSATQKEFLDIQKRLDMAAVIDYLRAWDAIQVGAIGPVIAGAEKLNEIRADYIVDAVNDYSLPNAMVFTLFIFNTMYTDDMRSVLKKLAADKRMGSTILHMDPVLEIIKRRGLNIDDYKDPGESAYYFARGVGRSLKNFLGSSELAKGSVGSKYFNEQFTLPPEYQEALGKIETAEFEESMSPGNVIFGSIDYISFGIPGSVYGLARGTVEGVIDLAKGNYEAAGGELTGMMLLILSFVGAKAVAKIRAPAGPGGAVRGPAGPGQFALEQPKGVPKAVARLNTIVQLGADGEAAATGLINRLGEDGVLEVGRYIQADSKAARFVYENGVEGAEALQKAKGNLTEAAKLLPTIPKLQLPPPTAVPEPPPPAPKAVTPPVPPVQLPKTPVKPPAQKTPPSPPKAPVKPAAPAAVESQIEKPPVTEEPPKAAPPEPEPKPKAEQPAPQPEPKAPEPEQKAAEPEPEGKAKPKASEPEPEPAEQKSEPKAPEADPKARIARLEEESRRLSDEAKAQEPKVREARGRLDKAKKEASDLASEAAGMKAVTKEAVKKNPNLEGEYARAQKLRKRLKAAERERDQAGAEYGQLKSEQDARYDQIRKNRSEIEKLSRPELELPPTERGRVTEEQVLREEGLLGIKKQFTLRDPKTGEIASTIPDGVRPNGRTVDVKDVAELSETQQLRLQREISRRAGQKAEIITGTRTKVPEAMERDYLIRRRPDLGPRE